MRQKTIDAIMAHAAAEYPRECCGVVAQKSRVERYFPCRNLAAEPTEHFHLSPEDYAAAEDWGTVVAIVHSHPDATTQASELDKAQCDATLLPWHIVSWPEGDLRTIQPRGELPLLERPFVLGHFDCWGLVMSYFRQTHGIELHDYRVDYPWWENDYPDNFYQDCWYECGFREFDGPPQEGDLVIMQVQADKWNHAGILLEGNMLLHHLYGHLSQRVPYGGY
ncbi:TPA: peptidase P60 [Enterobacter hormaechei]|nr:peptidase P60 [Enterobacter hormaechei]